MLAEFEGRGYMSCENLIVYSLILAELEECVCVSCQLVLLVNVCRTGV